MLPPPTLNYYPRQSTWRLTKHIRRKLKSAKGGTKIRPLGTITWKDRNRASWAREQTIAEDTSVTIKEVKWGSPGHVMRTTDNTWITNVSEWQPSNCRREVKGDKGPGGPGGEIRL